jgi:hypothetical protein
VVITFPQDSLLTRRHIFPCQKCQAMRYTSWKCRYSAFACKRRTSSYSWTNGWIISKFLSWVHLIKIHGMIPGFLIWPTFDLTYFWRSQQRSKFETAPVLARFITILPRTFYPCVSMYLGTIYLSTKFRPDRTSNLPTRWPSWKQTKWYYSWTNGCIGS